MAKRKWWQKLLTVLSFGAKQFEDGTLGAGKKTAKAGKIAGEVINTVAEAIDEGPAK